MKKSTLAIIPARGGSKRIPQKNIKSFHGKPLILYSIEKAILSKLFDKIIISTDDDEIIKTVSGYDVEIPFKRPKELSDDYTKTDDVINHAIEYLESKGEQYDCICVIYATAPLMDIKYFPNPKNF